MSDLSWWLAFGAGALSFISPCCLPLYPSYLSYITGISVSELRENRTANVRRAVASHTLFFILGFSIIFYALGFSATRLGQFFEDYKETIRMLGAVLIAVMGLFLMGVFQPAFLMREKRLEISSRRMGYLGSTLIGIGFAAGWTPCVGPIFASVLMLSASNPSAGLSYITAYTLGFAIPFFVMAFFLGRTRWILRHSARIMKVGGGVMVILGVLLYFNLMSKITVWMIQLFGGFVGV
ncbi:cytochrome C biogenesis protein CcdA [Polycladomyces abyssicola]|uniref:Cytochrome C biogenesis protein CcdA n=1 Tax=Polycladomyces abyssicola TaxID=1125966 RepID=A0A8D5UGP1_9BACL|nr:cytochrome c biogenesis protein CcdA [Polycladomyces abyssicola]BCU81637.1 cytochrome C biogenesis protein CcdA [Polycladomyces abyssicola]